MAGPRIRPDVWTLSGSDDWHPALRWYALAVAEMRKRSFADPTSWRFQAAIHEYDRDSDPLASASDALPSGADQARFWTQCQHFSWFFLPWHRAYLAVFEQIVAATVAQLGGPESWALPYWNYSDSANPLARTLPPAFRAETLPDGAPNPLRVKRDTIDAEGNVQLRDDDVAIRECLEEPDFAIDLFAGGTSFGGPRTDRNHDSGLGMGTVDRVPHGAVHVAVGGWMSSFSTAALDPIFWLHHANIDRLWTVWRRRAVTHTSPTEARWLTQFAFEFRTGVAAVASFTPAQVADSLAMPSPYRYEDESDPFAIVVESIEAPERQAMADRVPEMVGATTNPIVLVGRPLSTTLPVSPPTGPVLESLAPDGAPAEAFLNVENVTGPGGPMSYRVYVNVPEGSNAEDHPDLLAGTLPMFGLREATRAGARDAGGGLHYVLRISDIVSRLRARHDWDPTSMRVSFVPVPRGAQLESPIEGAEASPIQVGRVSLYVS